MNKVLQKSLLGLCFVITTGINAQIPNWSFEMWTKVDDSIEKPVGWVTTDGVAGAPNSITPFRPGYNSDTAVMLTVMTYNDKTWCSLLQTKFACKLRPTALQGYMKSNNPNNDSLEVAVSFTKNKKLIGDGFYTTNQDIYAYTKFTDNITFTDTAKPDTCIIIMGYVMQNPDVSTEYTIDYLQFLPISGINEWTTDIGELSIYPNPANSIVNISVFIVHATSLQINIYDLVGHQVKTIEHKEVSEGKSNTGIDISDLQAGVYFVSIGTENTKKFIKKLIVK